MGAPPDETTLSRVLPGAWTIAASNIPAWLSGERLEPRFSYELVGHNPLVLSHEVSYRTVEGEEKHVVSQDTWAYGEFRGRGKGLQRFFPSPWSVSGASEDGSIAVIHHAGSRAAPDGIDVVVREGAPTPELRATIARATEQFGLSPEEFGSLTWMAEAHTG